MTRDSRQPRLVYLTTDAISARCFLSGHLQEMRRAGYDVTVIASPGPHLDAVAEMYGVNVIGVEMHRDISPANDLVSLTRLVSLFRRLQPDIVNAGTPKAGLLGMLAARWCRVPVRIYLLRGLRLETTSGIKRALLWCCEWLAAHCAHRVVCVSHSLRERVLAARLAKPHRATVLNHGSSNGVQAERFEPTRDRLGRAAKIRDSLGIGRDDLVVGFVGRLTRDKGVHELLASFEAVSRVHRNSHLVLVGDFESGDPLDASTLERLRQHPRIHTTGFLSDPSDYYHLMDVVAFPSHREGFPNVPLEGAAAGKPVVAFAATGTIDAVRDLCTGRLVATGDVEAFTSALLFYLERPDCRRKHGRAGMIRVREDFRPEQIWAEWIELYRSLLQASHRTLPTELDTDRSEFARWDNRELNPLESSKPTAA